MNIRDIGKYIICHRDGTYYTIIPIVHISQIEKCASDAKPSCRKNTNLDFNIGIIMV